MFTSKIHNIIYNCTNIDTISVNNVVSFFNADYDYIVRTPLAPTYMATSKTFFEFQLQLCREGEVHLLRGSDYLALYRILIGSSENTLVQIYAQRVEKVVAQVSE